jgi:hypothetical protein
MKLLSLVSCVCLLLILGYADGFACIALSASLCFSLSIVEVIRWFADRADLIIVMFDAHKLDISDELKASPYAF